jgi:hypothetical protein
MPLHFLHELPAKLCRDSSVGIVNKLQAGLSNKHFFISVKNKDVFLLQISQKCSEADPASYWEGIGGSFPKGKAIGPEADELPLSK